MRSALTAHRMKVDFDTYDLTCDELTWRCRAFRAPDLPRISLRSSFFPKSGLWRFQLLGLRPFFVRRPLSVSALAAILLSRSGHKLFCKAPWGTMGTYREHVESIHACIISCDRMRIAVN